MLCQLGAFMSHVDCLGGGGTVHRRAAGLQSIHHTLNSLTQLSYQSYASIFSFTLADDAMKLQLQYRATLIGCSPFSSSLRHPYASYIILLPTPIAFNNERPANPGKEIDMGGVNSSYSGW